MDNNNDDGKKIVAAILMAVAATIPIFTELYSNNNHFRWTVNQAMSNFAYRLKFNSWRNRVWNKLDDDQRKAYVELHGDPEK